MSESQSAIDTAQPVFGGADIPPPFWELEELIGRGFSPERALAVLAAKRSGQYPATPSSDLIYAPDRQRQPVRHEPLMVILAGR